MPRILMGPAFYARKARGGWYFPGGVAIMRALPRRPDGFPSPADRATDPVSTVPFSGRCIRMPQVKLREGEPFDVALRRFKRTCEKAGLLAEVRRREAYEKPTMERKRKKAAAVKRHQKKVSREAVNRQRMY